ncbi:MAG: hypothetical protein IPM05_13820 [Propionivibrio sp.]|nr:hypothetical protein [Propionivibrio sp.]
MPAAIHLGHSPTGLPAGAKVEQGRRIGVASKVKGRTRGLVEGVFAGFVQIEPVGPQYSAASVPAATFRLRVAVVKARTRPGIRLSMRARNSALRVALLCFSNPFAMASVICFIILSLVVNTLRLTL